jgi:phage terminase large subunit-like protein
MGHSDSAHQYAQDVVAGKIPACKWIKLACQRHLDDLVKSADAEYPYKFDAKKGDRVCIFLEMLPHVKGKWAAKHQKMVLQPWQKWIVCSLFGWVHKSSGLRRFRIAYICVPRKNGKSFLAAGIGNYMLAADGEHGAEVYSGATSERQAWEIFRPAKQMVDQTESLRTKFEISSNAKTLVVPRNGSRFEPVIGKPGDGSSPSCALVDEYHEHTDAILYDVMLTGMGSREQPLLLVTTTAGSSYGGACFQLQDDVQKMLEGIPGKENEQLFGVVYTCDVDDDWSSEESLRKANPNFDISVTAEFLHARQKDALQSSSKQNVFKTKHLNIWVTAATGWMNMAKWHALADRTLQVEDFAGEPCIIALDLASKVDIAAAIKLFRRRVDDNDHYYVFSRFYLPEDRAQDPACQHYQGYVHDGKLITTPGNVIDYEFIKRDLLQDAKDFEVKELLFDPYAATQLIGELNSETSITTVEVTQNVKNLSEPMKQLEALSLSSRIHHDGDPVMTWMLSNVVARMDANENVYPRKQRNENKIDGPVALIMTLSRAQVLAEEERSFEIFRF